jgi:Flp pilus assembly protein TadG
MSRLRSQQRLIGRKGVATLELAILLPFLCFLFVVSVDFARVFYFAVTVQNCARNGAYYASDYPNTSYIYNDIYGYTSINDAVLRDAGNLSPTPTYQVAYSTSPDGPFNLTSAPSGSAYVQVTVNWTFQTITNYPGVPSTLNLSRTTVMQVAPAMPSFN